jgi:four helix bundle protein
MSNLESEWLCIEEEGARWGTTGNQNLANELEERLIELAVKVINMTTTLPKTAAGLHIANQILRSGTSPAPNYGEARGAESRADFAHKLGIVCKELNETCIWLRIIKRSNMLPESRLGELLDESIQLSRIITKSRKTLRSQTK